VHPNEARGKDSGTFLRITNGPRCRPYVDYDRIRAEYEARWPGEPFSTKRREQPWRFKRYTPLSPALNIANRGGGYLIVEPNLKPSNTMPGKDWGWANWQALVIARRWPAWPWVQIGPPGTRLLEGVAYRQTNSFDEAMGALAGAVAAVLPEGGLHHAAAALGIPSVVIFGGATTPASTGYELHRNLTSGGAESPCGMRIPCEHCRAAMANIRLDRVIMELEDILNDG